MFLSAREKILNEFKSKIFLVKYSDKIPAPEPAPEQAPEATVFDTAQPAEEQAKKSSSKLYQDFLDKIANDETSINTEIFNKYFKYQNLSFLVKDLHDANKTINEK